MQDAVNDSEPAVSSEGYDVDELSGEHSDLQTQLCIDILRDIDEDKLVLPSLPDQALAIRRLIEKDDASASVIAKAISSDAAMAAKLIKTANSPLYAGSAQVGTCAKAVVRLGAKSTAQLVTTYALRELFSKGSGPLKQRIVELWEHSTEVGAISFVLARLTGRFDPERAMLAGLLHDIAVTCILTYAERIGGADADLDTVDRTIEQLRAQLGGMILRAWNFPEDIVTAAEEAEDWMRDPSPEPDYADLVIVAQLHNLATVRKLPVSSIESIPAVTKLLDGGFRPEVGVEVLSEARQQIDEARNLFAA